VTGFVRGPFQLEFELAPGQTTATFSDTSSSLQVTATVTRVNP
jgi:hypothetical protein